MLIRNGNRVSIMAALASVALLTLRAKRLAWEDGQGVVPPARGLPRPTWGPMPSPLAADWGIEGAQRAMEMRARLDCEPLSTRQRRRWSLVALHLAHCERLARDVGGAA